MASVVDVAKYILLQQGKMSTWKLQKLCFYSQAWAIAWTENPLFDEEFEAWSNGPVCPILFSKHKGRFMIDYDGLRGDEEQLSDDEKDTINIVLKDYGDLAPYDLREQTHQEEPWQKAREGVPDGCPSNNVISKNAMGSFYGSL